MANEIIGGGRLGGSLKGKRIVQLGMEFRGITPERYKLGNVIRALAEYQAGKGASVRVYLPLTKDISKTFKPTPDLEITVQGHDSRPITVSTITVPGGGDSKISVILLGSEALFGQHQLYDSKDTWIYPWSIYAQAVMEHLRVTGFKPDAVHCHEWQTGLFALYNKVYTSVAENGERNRMRVLFTPHEVKHLGLFPADQWKYVGLPWDIFNHHVAEYFGQICMLKAGMAACKTIFDSREKLERVMAAPEPRGIGDFIKDKAAKRKVAFAAESDPDPARIPEEYCEKTSAHYFIV